MQNADEALKTVAITLEKYRKNKTLVPPEDLAGKYKVPFQKLKAQLHDELIVYIKAYSLGELVIRRDKDGKFDALVRMVDKLYEDGRYKTRFGKAAFKEFDLEAIKRIAEELRIQIYNEAWIPYFEMHTCLFATAECFSEDDPHIPRVYNSLVDKFYVQETGEWIEDEESKKPALLIFVGGGNENSNADTRRI